MTRLSRRAVLRASVGLAAAGTIARPYIANAAAKTAEVWWTQGFVPDEDTAFKKAVADFEKQSGDKIAYSIVPFAPLRQKIISAMTSGIVPDLMDANPTNVVPELAWKDKLVDVSDVVETQKSHFSETALLGSQSYNAVKKHRSFYGVPYKGGTTPFHVWGSLIEKAGHKRSDMPKTWDAFIDFFQPIQKELQTKHGMRHTYASGFVVSTIGVDPTNTFDHFLVAYGGENIVSKDGHLNAHDPKVKEAAIKALEKQASLFKAGFIPPSSVNWNDADDNNAFHSKLCVMDFDGTLSTEVAMLRTKEGREAYYHEVMTLPMPLSNDGKPLHSFAFINLTMIPKGAKNVAVAKDFMKYMIQPEVSNAFLKGGLGRWLPTMPEIAKNDSWWTDPKRDIHVAPYTKQGLFSPTLPYYYIYNPAYAEVWTEHVWNQAFHDIVNKGMGTEPAANNALKRIEEIFAKYPIEQA
jgi:multiple sugar transport system substrate-binding protein